VETVLATLPFLSVQVVLVVQVTVQFLGGSKSIKSSPQAKPAIMTTKGAACERN
jgi:hypothetical protein